MLVVDSGLGVTSVITNFHHRRVIPLMERELRIFEMSDVANPVSLARSRLLQERLLNGYAATRARRAVNLKTVPHSHDDLWSFVMLPDIGPVSTVFPLLFASYFAFFVRLDSLCPQAVNVHAAQSDPPTPRSQAAGCAMQQREWDRAVLAKERRIRRQELLDQYNKEYR
jgi:hypothetical protein